jgi:hypothetical protein
MALCFMMRPLRAVFFTTASLEKTDRPPEFAALEFALSPCKNEIMAETQGRSPRSRRETKPPTKAVADHI